MYGNAKKSNRHGYGAQAQKGKPGWLVPAATFAAIAIPLAVWATTTVPEWINAPRFDREWCLEGKPADNIVVWLDDQTDMFSQRQGRAVHERYQSLYTAPPGLPVRGRLVLLVMDSKSRGMARQVDSFCRPPLTSAESGTGATDNYLAPIYQRFVGRAEAAEKDATSEVPSADESPILESIQSISKRADFRAAAIRQLIIATDLLQHVKGGIEEKDNGGLEIEKFLKTPYGRGLMTDLHGVEVQVLYLKRGNKRLLQTTAHEAFWRAWLTRMGAKITDFTPVPE